MKKILIILLLISGCNTTINEKTIEKTSEKTIETKESCQMNAEDKAFLVEIQAMFDKVFGAIPIESKSDWVFYTKASIPVLINFCNELDLIINPTTNDWTQQPYTSTTVPVQGTYPEYVSRHAQIVAQQDFITDQTVVFLGDSITNDWTSTGIASWDTVLSGFNRQNYGIGSDTTQGMLWRIQNGELENFPKVVILLAGTNDIFFTPSITATQLAKRVQDLAYAIRVGSNYTTKVIIMGLLPRHAFLGQGDPMQLLFDTNNILRELESPGISYLDTWSLFTNSSGVQLTQYFVSDSGVYVHLNADGYEALAPIVKNRLLSFK